MSSDAPDGGSPDDVESLWLATTERTDYAPLEGDRRVDVAVVGGGITGLTAAIELTEAGREVAVLEADRIVEGTSGYTTAKLTSQHGLVYETLHSRFGREKARQYADANQAAIEAVAARVDDLGVDVDFERTPAYVYARSDDDVDDLHEEARTAQRLGLPAEFTASTDAPFDVAGALRFDDQAQFHPRKYLLAVAEAVHDDGGQIYEQTRAIGLESGSPCRVETERGTVTADHVVVASLFPFADRAGYFARMHPSRGYLLAVELESAPPEGMYLGAESPPPTFRPHPSDDRDLLIVGGQSHKPSVGGPPASERYRRCEAFAREHFPVESVRCRWSAHDYVPVDGVPFVGELDPLSENVYVGVGFNKWGMTGGTAAGTIVADLIVDGSNPWADVFDPTRFSLSGGLTFLEENATVGTRLLRDWATAMLSSGADSALPARGEGTVLRRGARPIAVYRDESGELHAVSAVCRHMGCILEWNDAERTWDCPCHGSRFDRDGTVKRGPAREDLPHREV